MDIATLFLTINTLLLLLLGITVARLLLGIFRRPPKQ